MNEEVLENLKVVKRNGKKVDFDSTKIAITIKKGFDGAIRTEEDETKYDAKDVQKVYQSVIKKIIKDYKNEEKIKIEDIQDLIEEMLKKYKYDEVYQSFSGYRERREKSRQLFSGEKKMHKFLRIRLKKCIRGRCKKRKR